MKLVGRLNEIGKIEATIEITMTLDEFSALDKELSGRWPGSRLSSLIHDLLSRSRAVYSAEVQKDASG